MSFLKDLKPKKVEIVKQTVKQTTQKKQIVKQKTDEIEIEPFIDWEKIAKSSEFKRLIYLAITGKPTRDTSRVITSKLNNIKKIIISGDKK